MNVYSARPRLVGLALYTVTDNYRDCVQRVALGRPNFNTRSKQKAGR